MCVDKTATRAFEEVVFYVICFFPIGSASEVRHEPGHPSFVVIEATLPWLFVSPSFFK